MQILHSLYYKIAKLLLQKIAVLNVSTFFKVYNFTNFARLIVPKEIGRTKFASG